ncbi:P-loop containing nucleoside triphosphate hydrolase protein [Lobosporangium transversale]|uniref:p-loop containing nucleoside triphosphate hydrolase protein n=1 Tax=Lobosporangium transversale TaxID=64571 RepID=A0A1Y2GF14_9FUNG|nr:P-loop containing nucleoside triphosphate hydrolase protein [Lobosporangium transversale]ORZ09044.1 P-loop containing nucleoside triphosphate hydrolase protein [Lobosporangium transversale]|eukprot:XP_021878671.1 P-loop containing nucleoside triphosphate hydrolase protein [Lobosporangium transversale]
MGFVIRFFDDPNMSMGEGMAYAIGLFLVTLFHGTMHHHYFFPTMRTGLWIRQSLISLMYRKCLTLSTSSSIATGTVVNLISNDVQPFENATPFMLYAIIGPIEMAVVMYFLWREINVACLSGLLVFAILVPIQTYFSRQFARIRIKTVDARDDRIRTLSDVFQGIELVKLCAWEVPFQEKILMLRSLELKYIWKANLMRASNMAIYFFFLPLTALFVFVTFWLQGETLTPDKIFVSLTLFNVMRLTMTAFFPRALETIAETRVSVRRITDFMLLPELRGIENEFRTKKTEELDDDPEGRANVGVEKVLDPSVLLEMRDASFSWTVSTNEQNEIIDLSAKENSTHGHIHGSVREKDQQSTDNQTVGSPKKAILNNITMSLRRDELLAIVGPVGCGKSSFCMALLQEMPLVSGSFALAKKDKDRVTMSYSAQSPWIFAGTIKSNILFGSQFNQERYDKVIKACELTRDLSLFPQGDETVIGEKGVTLSGGQRARVSLARAAYRDSDVYILDDPLSAVDPKVGRALFENCINGLLKGKARVLVTHQLQYIKDCENVIVLEQGQVTHAGRVDAVMQHEVEVERVINDGASIRSIKTRAKFVDVLREFAKKAPEVTEDEDTMLILKAEEAGADLGEVLKRVKSRAESNKIIEDDVDAPEKNLTVEEIQEGDTPLRVYYDFFRLGSTPFRLMLAILSLSAAQGIMVAGDFFLSKWSSLPREEQTRSYYPTVFGIYCLATVIMTLIRSFLFFYCVSESSRNIFKAMLDALLKANIDFFHANPHGRVLNRFSKDMANCDELLPYTFFDATQIVFMLFGSVVVVCIVNAWVVISIPFLLGGFIFLRQIYIRTSRQVKRIDSQTRSPIYSQLSETLDGLTSVRAFGVGDRFMNRFVEAQETNGRAFFAYLICARWLGFRLDAVSALFLGITAVACVAVRDSQEAALVGLALNYVVQLSGELQWAVRQSVEAAILMVSVERMMEYAQIKPEESSRRAFNPDGTSVVPNGWPSEAKVTFTDMSLTYPRGEGPVLKHISLNFRAGERIGIVGRTGAGKSSLIGALFRLVETTTGNPPQRGGITIDGIDISKIGMHDLREKMAIIPQEPFLFRGSLRFNLDPFSQHQDADLWAALEAAELKRTVEGLEGGLDAVVDDNGKNFSIGERQLLSLARAVLRRSKIIVMDEATANVDLQSDRMIQKAIHSQFQDATVFTIAHRLNTVIGDYDRILVLDQGEVMEFDEPWVLLNKPGMGETRPGDGSDEAVSGGWLRRMVADTGAENEAALRQEAKEQWERRHGKST